MYDLGYFKMPDPVGLKDDEDWLPIPRISKTIPFGYVEHETDDDLLMPIIEELEALELAKDYLKEYSYREVARWLSDKAGRQISHVGLRKRVQIEKKRKGKAETYKLWLKKYEAALQKLEEIESKHTGAKKERKESNEGYAQH
jgi:hypothetical protein|tara:strand:+ start:1503 stop:1931 length:429 start_codon:yes stop_codon:yes gene_type:complete